MVPSGSKQCTYKGPAEDCGQRILPETSEFFRQCPVPRKDGTKGFKSWCLDCERSHARSKYVKTRKPPATHCSNCGTVKRITKGGRYCPICRNEQTKEYQRRRLKTDDEYRKRKNAQALVRRTKRIQAEKQQDILEGRRLQNGDLIKTCKCGQTIYGRRQKCNDCVNLTRKRNSVGHRQKYGSAVERGYGYEHIKLRRKYAEELHRVGFTHCWRCGEIIYDGQPWHLGHDDWDRSKYRGPEHAKCNTAAAARKTNMIRRGRALEQSTRRKSRRW